MSIKRKRKEEEEEGRGRRPHTNYHAVNIKLLKMVAVKHSQQGQQGFVWHASRPARKTAVLT